MKELCIYVFLGKTTAEAQATDPRCGDAQLSCLGCDAKWEYAVCDNKCIKCLNTCCEHKVNIVNSLLAIGRKHQDDQVTVNKFVGGLYKLLSPQVDSIMLSDELSRIRNQRYLDRIAFREAACSYTSRNDFDFDDYETSQLFFEKQHRIR
jgi:hypothetical protein